MKLPEEFLFKAGNRAVLLLHALTGSPNDMRMLGRALEKANYTVYTPMLTGHGTLDVYDILKASPELWYEDVKNAILKLKNEGYQEIAVFGLSLGGLLTVKAAMDYDFIGAGTFCAPIFANEGDSKRINQQFLDYARTVLRLNGIKTEDIEGDMVDVQLLLERLLDKIELFKADVSSNLPKIDEKFFVAQSGQDELIDPEGAYLFVEGLVNSDVTFKWYPDSTHVITVGKDHKVLEEDIIAFLDQLNWMEAL